MYPPKKRLRKTRTHAKNVATHVATPTIFGGKWRYKADKMWQFEHGVNTHEQPKTPSLAFRMRYHSPPLQRLKHGTSRSNFWINTRL
jgi:hypothetical protein